MHQRGRILVVDVCQDTAHSLAVLLDLWGYDVYSAHDGRKALEMVAVCRPDAVILDIGLPGMNGFDLAQAIRQKEGGARILLVAQTGYGQEGYRRRSREVGIDHYLLKPVDPEELRQLLACRRPALPERATLRRRQPVGLALASPV